MTPLEEIERDIGIIRKEERLQQHERIKLLGPLYQARAIERLEATVRAIGVFLQDACEPDGELRPPRDRFTGAQEKQYR